ncbi:MAG: hypothetical protein PVI63_08535, partial [Anaerolineae bacterium]
MTTPIQRLTKILRLEAEKHQDQAVVSGLASYAATWTREAEPAFGPQASDWVKEIAERLRTYSALPNTAARREALSALIDVLNRGPEVATQSEPPSPRHTVERPKSGPRPARSAAPRATLDSPITDLRGIGPKRAQSMARLGLSTIRDMLYFLPRRYDDYSQLKAINRLRYGEEVTIIARVREAELRSSRAGRPIFRAILTDGTGSIDATWFNQPYLARSIRPGQ